MQRCLQDFRVKFKALTNGDKDQKGENSWRFVPVGHFLIQNKAQRLMFATMGHPKLPPFSSSAVDVAVIG